MIDKVTLSERFLEILTCLGLEATAGCIILSSVTGAWTLALDAGRLILVLLAYGRIVSIDFASLG